MARRPDNAISSGSVVSGAPAGRLWITTFACLLAGSGSIIASANPLQDSRPNAAPWRPSFGTTSGTAAGINLQTNPAAAADPGRNGPLPPPPSAGTAGPTGTAPPAALPAQPVPPTSGSAASTTPPATAVPPAAATAAPQSPQDTPPPATSITRVSQSSGSLPNGDGQVWREYDILPYTAQVSGSNHPERAVTDWILRQTGREMWFHEPFGILSASRERLIVYHTPEIHNQILPIVDRLNNSRAQPQLVELGLYTITNPNWRTTALAAMQPVELASPGVEGWLVSKENAARILHQLSSRNDFRSQASGRAIVHDGQEFVLERRNPDQFLRTIQWTPGQGTGYQPVLTQFNEGYELALSLLTSLDGRSIEAAVRCRVDQIERKTTVPVPVTDAAGNVQRINLQVPQVVSWRLEERVRWPVDQVLVLSCGVVSVPRGDAVNRPLGGLLDAPHLRADALLFIDYRGPTAERPDGATANNRLTPVTPR